MQSIVSESEVNTFIMTKTYSWYWSGIRRKESCCYLFISSKCLQHISLLKRRHMQCDVIRDNIVCLCSRLQWSNVRKWVTPHERVNDVWGLRHWLTIHIHVINVNKEILFCTQDTINCPFLRCIIRAVHILRFFYLVFHFPFMSYMLFMIVTCLTINRLDYVSFLHKMLMILDKMSFSMRLNSCKFLIFQQCKLHSFRSMEH